MQYRKLKGDQIFTGYELLNGHLLVIDEEGTVQDMIPDSEAGEAVETYRGILTPGFINCHCHIELSHLKDAIPPGTGLVNFLIAVVKNRTADAAVIEEKIAAAANELYNNGIVGVADICNKTDAISIKRASGIRWHNLIEVINLYDTNLDKQLALCNDVLAQYQTLESTAVLTPHAPYTVSAATYERINNATANEIISIHNQETDAENELFQGGTGDFLKLYAQFGNGVSPFGVSGKTSLQTWLPHFTNGQTILLVHNTFIREEDILLAQQHAEKYQLHIVYCICPNANLYIENALPPVDLLIKHHCTIVPGTDSYSSNWQLSIAAEMKTLLQHFPQLSLSTVLQWATAAAAKVMRWDNDLGSFEKGKKPGVVLLDEKTFSARRII